MKAFDIVATLHYEDPDGVEREYRIEATFYPPEPEVNIPGFQLASIAVFGPGGVDATPRMDSEPAFESAVEGAAYDAADNADDYDPGEDYDGPDA